MKDGVELFKAWMRRMQFSQRDAAEHFGWNETFISKLVRGHRRPGRINSVKIEDLTGIPVRAWAVSELPKSSRRNHATNHKCN